jgi:hypothetical protein
MTCFQRFMDWLNNENIPESEQSIIRDLKIIGVIQE